MSISQTNSMKNKEIQARNLLASVGLAEDSLSGDTVVLSKAQQQAINHRRAAYFTEAATVRVRVGQRISQVVLPLAA